MKRRIYGIETEYALGIETKDGSIQSFDPGELYSYLETSILKHYLALRADSFGRNTADQRSRIEIKEGFFLENGARIYYDTGHAEWSTPETTTSREAVLYEIAGEQILSELAKSIFFPNGSRLFLVKNNVDYAHRTTYGCHENYLVKRIQNLNQDQAFFKHLVEQLVPFLVTRQIFCGAGKLGSHSDSYGGYQISQRADFIECVTSQETRSERGIINERDESLGNNINYRRLHLIVGDSNMSPYAAILKLGTTGIILRLIEENALKNYPVLYDPVQAIKSVSRDLTCSQPLALKNGEPVNPVKLQQWYLNQALHFFQTHELDQDSKQILSMWQNVLDDLSTDPMRLADRVDWVIKLRYLLEPPLEKTGTSWQEIAAWKGLLENLFQENNGIQLSKPSERQYARYQRYVNQYHLNWNDYETQYRLYFSLRERDLRYHDIDPEKSLYYYLAHKGILAPGFDDEQIEIAKRQPPSDTRARVRSEIIHWAYNDGVNEQTLLDWGCIQLPSASHPIFLDNPFEISFNTMISKIKKKGDESNDNEDDGIIRILDIEDIPHEKGLLKKFKKWFTEKFS